MVRLDKIVIQGFKSFKRKVSIPFPDGFSIITGPNGSGKTNVSDAVCFVLGKASSRDMRAKKAQDLIFHGSKKKEGSDYASVTLFFDNNDRRIPVDEKEVSISRKINTKGVSTYRLNGRVVNRQQIIDVLLQAGIHPEGHNIIQQGDVNQIVEMDAVERREVIDNIAGITDYEEKKQKAVKEMEKIEERVREADILLQERGFTMEKLKKERDAAMKYKELQADLEKIRAAVTLKAYNETKAEMDKISKDLEEKNRAAEELERKIAGFDKDLMREEKKLEELTKDVIKATGQIEVTKRLAKLQAEIEKKQDRIESNRSQSERLSSMIERMRSMQRNVSPELKKVLQFKGVHGYFSDIVTVPKQYRIAVDIAAGSHMQDIVVDTTNTAVVCVKYLKDNKVGRARFLPLEKIQPFPKKPLPPATNGWLSSLVHHDPKYTQVIEFVLGSTACVDDVDKAKQIAQRQRIRMVTLDGDLFEASGAITGGYLKKKESYDTEISKYVDEKARLEDEIIRLEGEIKAINKELEILASKEKKTKVMDLEKERVGFDEKLRAAREQRKQAYEQRLILQQEIGKLNIQRARLEASFDNIRIQREQEKGQKDIEALLNENINVLKRRYKETIETIDGLGPINMRALDDFENLRRDFEDFKQKVDKIMSEKAVIEDTVKKIEEKRFTTFNSTLQQIAKNFKEIFREMTNGEADLTLQDPASLDSGLMIKASPSGKKLLNIDSMSGGEKTLTAFAFLFAIQKHKPTPFYVLDEADATLDAINSKRIAEMIRRHSSNAQFIVISHNSTVIKEADQIYGVSMEDGESKVIGLELPEEN